MIPTESIFSNRQQTADNRQRKFKISNSKSQTMELTRFSGHLILREKGVHDAKTRSKVPT